MRDRQAALRFERVVSDLGCFYFLQVVQRLELVEVLVPDNVIFGIGHGNIFMNVDAKPGIGDRFWHPHERLHHHVNREVTPLEKCPAQKPLVVAAFQIIAAQRQLIAAGHLVPADLVDHHKRANGLESVEFAPQGAFLCLDGQGGDFGLRFCQPAQDLPILFTDFRHRLPLLLTIIPSDLIRAYAAICPSCNCKTPSTYSSTSGSCAAIRMVT